MKAALAVLILAVTTASSTFAQHHEHSPGAHSPYSAMADRQIKALSAQQISDLQAGRGMSLALPAELNGYPGPRHVLELEKALELTPAQAQQAEALVAEMKSEAIALGLRIIESERALDRLFASRSISDATLREVTAQAAALQGELRAVHLKYHLTMRGILSPAQLVRYSALRGYARD
jgi:Spy/CpxP family protein refolding chaperone